jgi:aromatic ring-cleaving dioxygenase
LPAHVSAVAETVTKLWLDCPRADVQFVGMTQVRDFHAHIYYDADEVDHARALAARMQQRFGVPVGHFHLRPVGPHPRGSVQITVPEDRFGDVARWLAVNRDGLTIFAHASTGDDLADHSVNVVWFGPSEELNLSLFH